jgi:hypothetical protein
MMFMATGLNQGFPKMMKFGNLGRLRQTVQGCKVFWVITGVATLCNSLKI